MSRPASIAPGAASAPTPTAWFSLVGPVGAWGIHELLSTFAVVRSCAANNPPAARVALVLIAIGCLALASAGCFVAWRRALAMQMGPRDEGRERSEWMSLVAVVVSSMATLAIVWATLPVLLLSKVCEATR